MSRLNAQAVQVLRERLAKEKATADVADNPRPRAISGSPDATAQFGGAPAVVNNPFVPAPSTGSVDPGTAPSGGLAPLIGSREAEGSREVRLDPASGQPISKDFAFSVNAGEGDFASAQIARGLLANGQFQDEAHKTRLEQIIKTSDDTEFVRARADVAGNAAELKRQQQLSDFQMKKLIEAGADPKNPMSVAEFDQVAAEIQRNSLAASLPNPTQVRRKFEEADNFAVDVANTSVAWADQFGLSKEQVASYFGQPANGKFFTQGEKKQVFDMSRLASGKDTPSGERTAVGNSLKRVDKEIEQFKESNPEMFDERGEIRGELSVGFRTTKEAVATDKRLGNQFLKLKREQATLADKQRSFVGDQSSPVSEPSSTLPVRSPQALPAGSPAVQSSDPAQLIGATQAAPIIPGPDDNTEDIINQAVALSASQENRIVYIQDPESGETFPIQAN